MNANQKCPKCGTQAPSNARFCPIDGTPLAATQLGGKTIVSPTLAQGIVPSYNVDEATRRVQTAIGSNTAPAMESPIMHRLGQQRELTCLVMDVSGSMDEDFDGVTNKLQAASKAGHAFLDQKYRIDPSDEVALVSFTEEAQIQTNLATLSTHMAQLKGSLSSLMAEGGTNIEKGLAKGGEALRWTNEDVVRRIVLMTDGHGGNPIQTAEGLKSDSVVIDVIGVGPQPSKVDEKLLKQVASVVQGQTRYRFIRDSRTLVNHYTILGNKTLTR